MKSLEEIHLLDRIFQNLDQQNFASFPEELLTKKDEGQEKSEGFSRECIRAKYKILKILHSDKDKLKDEQFKMICRKLKVLSSSHQYLEKEGLINLYIDIYDEKKKAKKTGSRESGQIAYKLLRSLEGLIRYFFLKQELKEYRKYKNMLPPVLHEQIEGLNEAMEQKIKDRTFTKKCSELFKQYLKNQQANHQKQLCRVCYKKISIVELAKHLNLCGKKTYLKQQLTDNFSRRLNILQDLEKNLHRFKQTGQIKKIQNIEKVVKFYKNLRVNTNSKRMSIRFEGENSLFFENIRNRNENEKDVELLSELRSLEDKVLCLTKKLKEVQAELNQDSSKNEANFLKLSVGPTLQKYQSIQNSFLPKPPTITALSPNQTQTSTYPQPQIQSIPNYQQSSYKKIEQEQQENDNQKLTVVKRKIKKTISDFQRRHSADSKTEETVPQSTYSQISINNFQILKILGKGAFGRVYLVRRKKTKDVYALKAIRIDKTWGQNQLNSIKNEYGIYKKIEGDHLVTATFSFHQKNAQFFVLEFMPGGDLSSILQSNVYLEEQEAKFYLAEILLAIEHLHKSGIVHRDLKPENIVLDSRGHLKLTDFGLSQFRVLNKLQKALDKKNIQQKQQLQQCPPKKIAMKSTAGKKLIGTPDYIAPEIIDGSCLTNPTIDWWSFGVIAYEMMIGCRPFSANTVEEILSNIQKGEIQLPEIGDEEGMISGVAADFVGRLLEKDYQRRLGFGGVEEIKAHKFFQGIDWKNLKNLTPPLSTSNSLNTSRQFLSDDPNLRRQLQILMESQSQNPLQQLRNYVRYDLLTAQTLQSVKSGAITKQTRIRKLKSIAYNFEENQEPRYKPTLSEDQDYV